MQNAGLQAKESNLDINPDSASEGHWSGLPIWGVKAAERGFKLPSPMGVGIYFNDQIVPYTATSDFELKATGGLLDGSDVYLPQDDVTIEGRDQSFQVRADVWLFPFLNVYGLVGYTQGNKDIVAQTANVVIPGKPILEGLLRNAGSITVPIEYEAVNVGVGGVIAGQVDPFDWHPFIITGVGAFAVAKTTATDNQIYTTIGALKVGQRYEVPGGKLAGLLRVTYQRVNQDMTGSYSFTGTSLAPLMESVQYDVSLQSAETVNMAATLMYDFGETEDWSVLAEYGFLNWKQLTLGLTRRF